MRENKSFDPINSANQTALNNKKFTATHVGNGRPSLHVVASQAKKVRRDTTIGMNQHVKASIHRLVFNSELQITSLKQVARLVGITGPRSEAKVLDAIRETARPTYPTWTGRAA